MNEPKLNNKILKVAKIMQLYHPVLYRKVMSLQNNNKMLLLQFTHLVEFRYFMLNHYCFKNTWLGCRLNYYRVVHYFKKYGYNYIYSMINYLLSKKYYNLSRNFITNYNKSSKSLIALYNRMEDIHPVF